MDPRLNLFRPDLADIRLKDTLLADRYVAGKRHWVTTPVLDLKLEPDDASGIGTQALLGEDLDLFEERNGWCWVQLKEDGYVGYVRADGIAKIGLEATHRVSVPRTFVYSEADLRSPVVNACSMGSRLALTGETTTRGARYLDLAGGGAVVARHVELLAHHVSDYVDVAGQFVQTPYLWGGRSGFGIDCSGLVQLSMAACGRDVLRDTDMQERSIGQPVACKDDYSDLLRGDLVFWKGHVAIVESSNDVLHASGHAMQVVREPLSDAIERIRPLYGLPTGVRRP
nr:NlpC/P60 family protein [Hoeflea prorocentri]